MFMTDKKKFEQSRPALTNFETLCSKCSTTRAKASFSFLIAVMFVTNLAY